MTPEQVISALRRQFNATGRVPTLREWFDVDPTNRWWEQYDLIPGKVYFFESGRGFGWFPYKLAGKPYPGYEGPYVAGGYPGDGPYTGPWYGPYSPEPVIPPYAVVGNPNIHYTGDQKWSYPGYRNADPDGSPEWFSEHQLESQLRAMRQQPRKIEQWLSVIDPQYLEVGDVPEVPPEIVEPPEPEVVEEPPTEPPWGACAHALR